MPEEEEENNEDAESGNSVDDEDMDDMNHTALPKEVVRPNTPTVRPQTADIWKHVSRIAKHDVPDRAMKTECTHVCVYRLDDEDGEKRYCNTPLKLFRASSAKAAPWSTSAALAHFKKKHEASSSARKQKAGATKRQTRLSECMHAAGSQGIQSISSKKSTYALSENEKVLSAIARWATYASMNLRVQNLQSNPAHCPESMGSVSAASAGNTISGPGGWCSSRCRSCHCRTRATAGSRWFLRSKGCCSSCCSCCCICRSSG